MIILLIIDTVNDYRIYPNSLRAFQRKRRKEKCQLESFFCLIFCFLSSSIKIFRLPMDAFSSSFLKSIERTRLNLAERRFVADMLCDVASRTKGNLIESSHSLLAPDRSGSFQTSNHNPYSSYSLLSYY